MSVKDWNFFVGFKKRHIVLIVSLLLVFFAALYGFAITSDAFEAAEHFARSSPEVLKQAGTVEKLSFRPLGGFHITYSGAAGSASFLFEARGSLRTVTVDVRLLRRAEIWEVENLYVRPSKS